MDEWMNDGCCCHDDDDADDHHVGGWWLVVGGWWLVVGGDSKMNGSDQSIGSILLVTQMEKPNRNPNGEKSKYHVEQTGT